LDDFSPHWLDHSYCLHAFAFFVVPIHPANSAAACLSQFCRPASLAWHSQLRQRDFECALLHLRRNGINVPSPRKFCDLIQGFVRTHSVGFFFSWFFSDRFRLRLLPLAPRQFDSSLGSTPNGNRIYKSHSRSVC